MSILMGLLVVAQAASTSAPGDRYFGRLNMSALRIRYETMQLKKRYESRQLLPEEAEHLLILTEDAFDEWRRRYSKDPWLPSTGFAIAKLYEELPGTDARDRAVALFVYVKSRFPSSAYAVLSRNELHRGVSAKRSPAWADARRAAKPTPAASARSGASPAASGSPAAMPSSPPPGAGDGGRVLHGKKGAAPV